MEFARVVYNNEKQNSIADAGSLILETGWAPKVEFEEGVGRR